VGVDASGRSEREQDFRLLIGSEPFDPIEEAGRAPAAAMDAAAGAQATIVLRRVQCTEQLEQTA
jgi:hypothetical protein